MFCEMFKVIQLGINKICCLSLIFMFVLLNYIGLLYFGIFERILFIQRDMKE